MIGSTGGLISAMRENYNLRGNAVVDPKSGSGEFVSVLPEAETSDAPRKRRRYRLWIVLAGLFVAGLYWLNGPGLRWLAPKLADHFLPKTGLRGTFELEGSLTGGLVLKNLRLESDKALALLTVGKLIPEYRLGQLMKGRLDGIKVHGLHADLRLGLENDKPEKPKDQLNLESLLKTLRAVRSHVILVEADLDGISLNATRDGKRVISLAKSGIRHKTGEAGIDLEIGAITDATGREWPARKSSISWNEDELKIDRLDPLPGVSVREFAISLPESGGLSAETELHVDDAVFLLTSSPGLSSIQINLREGRLDSDTLAGHFNMKLPAGAGLSSLSANVDNLLPDPKAATISVQLFLENVAYEDWSVPELSLDAALESGQATLAARGIALGSGFSVEANSIIDRSGGGFLLGETRGHFNVASVADVVASLADRIKAIDPEAPVPASVMDGDFKVSFSDNRPDSAEVAVALKPEDVEAASPLSVKARWQPGQAVSARVELDGLVSSADYDPGQESYRGTVAFKDFRTARIDRWLDIVKAGTQGALSLTGNWEGGGSVKENLHHGTFDLAAAEFVRDAMPPVRARGGIGYDWPEGFTTKDLRVDAADQSVAVDLKLADGFLQMDDLLWKDGENEMAAGSAKLPVPDDFTKWREMLARDSRPLEVDVNSKVLSLAGLKDWLPEAGKLDPRSTGRLGVKVSGTYAKPVINADIELRDLRSPEQPDLPPADLKLTITAKEGHLSVDGNVIAPQFPPAVLSASMPFRPAEWAEKPGLVMEEKITARADFPRIDLSRFTTLVPGVKKLSGALSGNIVAAGEIRMPELKGRIDLSGGALEMKRADIPPVTGLAASVDMSLEKITLKEFKATVAGGTLSAGGSLAIKDGKPGSIDFRVKGDHLPLKRDESLIVRANADLRLSGSWEQAALTGTAGVVDSIFFRDIELLPIGSPFTGPSAAALPKIDAPTARKESMPLPFRNWTLDVAAKTVNPFLIRGNLATGKVVANLRVGGTFGKPAPDGEVKISDFKASLPFSTLTVPKGIVRFTPENGFDPVLEIRGSAEPRPYQVGVFVYGKASDPQLVLTSSPPLPENEIMTLLATGTTTSGLEDPQTASTRALQLFAEEIRRGRFGVGKQLRPLLKLLDRVDFSVAEADPYSSGSYSTATLELTDRWYLSAGMSGDGDSRVLGIWRLRFY